MWEMSRAEDSEGRQQLNDLEGGLAVSNLNWRAAYSCGICSTPHPQGYNSWERGRGHKRPHPDPGLEAYLTPQTNAKGKADWSGRGRILSIPGWGFNWGKKGTLHSLCR